MSAGLKAEILSIDDARREARIKELARLMKLAQQRGQKEELGRLFAELRAAALARSPEQVARMERDMAYRIKGENA